MNRLNSSLLSAAVTGLFMGGAGCAGTSDSTNPAAMAVKEKHACAKRNSCRGNGGCSTGDMGCAGKNTCQAKGGCATVQHHDCKGKNTCKGLGGCTTGDRGCKAQNTCSGKGGCAVPIKH